MKKIVISVVAALAVCSASLSAMDLYVDKKGQVFITGGEGRVLLESKEAQDIKQNLLSHPELSQAKHSSNKKATPVYAKADKLKFSGTHYIGYTYKNIKRLSATQNYMAKHPNTLLDTTHKDFVYKPGSNQGNFEIRRSYIQLKAYLLDDPKSYFRVTLDTTYSNKNDGHADIYAKYAYVYLNDILPYTGVEIGMAHRPWIDYEEHQGWWMRSISKVFVEASEAAHLSNSSDLGVNFKTKTDYFTSEVGLFNGEGYHGANANAENNIGDGNSLEWRFTAAVLGNGTKKRKATKDTYLDASFFGQYNMDNSQNDSVNINREVTSETYAFYGAHAVFNMPNFLLAAQYVKAKNDNKQSSAFNGDGYSINSSVRLGDKKQFSVIGRYDVWKSSTQDNIDFDLNYNPSLSQTTQSIIYGVAWQQNENLKWLLSGQSFKAKDHREYDGDVKQDWDAAMVTAEVHW